MLGNNGPKSLKDFKKVNNTNTSNNPILQQKQLQKKGKGNINLSMALNQDGNDMVRTDGRGNSYSPLPLEDVLPQNVLAQGGQSAPSSQINQGLTMEQPMEMFSQSVEMIPPTKEEFGFNQSTMPFGNNSTSNMPLPTPSIVEEDFPKPSFLADDNDYLQMAKENMQDMNATYQQPSVPMTQTQKPSNFEEKEYEKNMNFTNQNNYGNDNFAPFTQTPIQPTGNGMNKTYNSKSNIAKKVAEAEAEIDALVGNTEMFLENITKLKLEIINARNMDELQSAMNAAYNALNNIPMGFIDVETCRKIRVCFSHLEKTKKHLLETELGLLKLASIDDVNELEKTYMEVPASASTDTIYEIRTFELVLLNRLPEIKEQMMKEKVLLAYQQ